MLKRTFTMARVRSISGFAACLTIGLTTAVASAQTAATGPVIAQSLNNAYPHRIDVNGNDLSPSTRPINLNPYGVSHQDCIDNLRLRFTVVGSGFTANDHVEVWASNTTDCSSTTSRGIQSPPSCWQLAVNSSIGVASSAVTYTFDVWVRDLVGPQNGAPNPAGLAATQAHGRALGAAACATQPTFLPVPMYVWFMAVLSTGAVDGTPYEYGASTPFVTDLIGPPAPSGVTQALGDTLFTAKWTGNSDSDTVGYDVFIDPIPGQDGATAAPVDATVLECPETGASASMEAGTEAATSDSGDDAAGDAVDSDSGDDATADAVSTAETSTPSASDTACISVNVGGPPASGSACNDPILSSGVVGDGGGVTSSAVYDDAGNLIDGGVTTGSGGISAIPAQYLAPGAQSGLSVQDKSTGSYTIKGLKNGVNYNVAVAAVDGSGNVGPPSGQACGSPAPVNDFWNLYREGGGRAGGSFCALEAVGGPAPAAGGATVFATGALAVRRRRKRR